MAVPDGNHVLYIDQIQKSRPVQVQDWTGERFEHHTNAAGYVFLATWDDEDLEAYLARPLVKSSPVTETDPARLRELIELTRANGYAWSFEIWRRCQRCRSPDHRHEKRRGRLDQRVRARLSLSREPDMVAIGQRMIETATRSPATWAPGSDMCRVVKLSARRPTLPALTYAGLGAVLPSNRYRLISGASIKEAVMFDEHATLPG